MTRVIAHGHRIQRAPDRAPEPRADAAAPKRAGLEIRCKKREQANDLLSCFRADFLFQLFSFQRFSFSHYGTVTSTVSLIKLSPASFTAVTPTRTT